MSLGRSSFMVATVAVLTLGAGLAEAQQGFSNLRTRQTGLSNPKTFQGRTSGFSSSQFRGSSYGLSRSRGRAGGGSTYRLPGSITSGSPSRPASRGSPFSMVNTPRGSGLSLSSGQASGASYRTGSIGNAANPFRPNVRLGIGQSGISPNETLVFSADNLTAEQTNQLRWQIATQQAFTVWQGKALARPTLPAPGDKPIAVPKDNESAEPSETSSQSIYEPLTTRKNLYVAQQLSAARKHLGKRKYPQAVEAYRSVLGLDSKSIPARIGVVYGLVSCHRYQAAALNIIKLYSVEPMFWKSRYDLQASLGSDWQKLLEAVQEINVDLDKYIDSYSSATDARKSNNIVARAYLCKAYLAWLNGDQRSILQALQSAAKAVPSHPDVQQMYRKFAGLKEIPQHQFELTPAG